MSFRGHAPPIESGNGSGFRIKDSWCSVWYTRFIGSEEECKQWIERKHTEETPMVVDYIMEEWK